jgi:hypothetical protein
MIKTTIFIEILEVKKKPYMSSLFSWAGQKDFFFWKKANRQTYYLDKGMTEGTSTTIQLRYTPPDITKEGDSSSTLSSIITLVSGGE